MEQTDEEVRHWKCLLPTMQGDYLREKIETEPTKPELLVTIPGVGYRLEIKE